MSELNCKRGCVLTKCAGAVTLHTTATVTVLTHSAASAIATTAHIAFHALLCRNLFPTRPGPKAKEERERGRPGYRPLPLLFTSPGVAALPGRTGDSRSTAVGSGASIPPGPGPTSCTASAHLVMSPASGFLAKRQQSPAGYCAARFWAPCEAPKHSSGNCLTPVLFAWCLCSCALWACARAGFVFVRGLCSYGACVRTGPVFVRGLCSYGACARTRFVFVRCLCSCSCEAECSCGACVRMAPAFVRGLCSDGMMSFSSQ